MNSIVQTAFPRLATEPFSSALFRSSNDGIIGGTTDGIQILGISERGKRAAS
jgi:hypothetical protein